MASINDNPYKKFKKAFKGKPTGSEVHDFMKKKVAAPPKNELGLALKKKRKSTIGDKDVEHKSAKKRKAGPTIGDKDIEHKAYCKACKMKHAPGKHVKKKKSASK